MPQATEELRAEWPGGDREAIDWLESRGYTLRPDFLWENTLDLVPSPRDSSAILYLIEEWDYGGLVDPEP